MEERSRESILTRHHTLPHGSVHTHPSNSTLSQSQTSQQMAATPVMPVIPQPTPTALVSPTQLGHHPSLPSPSGPAPTNTYTGQVRKMCYVFFFGNNRYEEPLALVVCTSGTRTVRRVELQSTTVNLAPSEFRKTVQIIQSAN